MKQITGIDKLFGLKYQFSKSALQLSSGVPCTLVLDLYISCYSELLYSFLLYKKRALSPHFIKNLNVLAVTAVNTQCFHFL